MISPASLCEIKDRIHTNEESKFLGFLGVWVGKVLVLIVSMWEKITRKTLAINFHLILMNFFKRNKSSQLHQWHAQRASWDWDQLQSSPYQAVADADRWTWQKREGKQRKLRKIIEPLIVLHSKWRKSEISFVSPPKNSGNKIFD